MKFFYAGCAVFLAIVFISVWAWGRSPEQDPINTYVHAPARDHTDLAYRINHACRKGYKVVDWTTGDEFSPKPKQVIQVTCGAQGDNYDTYTVAVAR